MHLFKLDFSELYNITKIRITVLNQLFYKLVSEYQMQAEVNVKSDTLQESILQTIVNIQLTINREEICIIYGQNQNLFWCQDLVFKIILKQLKNFEIGIYGDLQFCVWCFLCNGSDYIQYFKFRNGIIRQRKIIWCTIFDYVGRCFCCNDQYKVTWRSYIIFSMRMCSRILCFSNSFSCSRHIFAKNYWNSFFVYQSYNCRSYTCLVNFKLNFLYECYDRLRQKIYSSLSNFYVLSFYSLVCSLYLKLKMIFDMTNDIFIQVDQQESYAHKDHANIKTNFLNSYLEIFPS